MDLKYIEFSKENLELIKDIQNKIFPDNSYSKGFDLLLEKGPEADGNIFQTYFIVYKDTEAVGMFGLYIPFHVEEHKSIWLGWYGIFDQFKGKGIGKQILLDAIEKSKEYKDLYGIKYFRLYTDENVNASAQPLYNKVMDLKEYYQNEEMYSDEAISLARIRFPGFSDEELKNMLTNSIVIFSKPLCDDEIVIPWNNRYIGFFETYKLEQDK